MSIKRPLDIKINIKPILFTLNHINAYKGPCRYGQGYALTYEYDVESAKREFDYFTNEMLPMLDKNKVNLLEPIMLEWHEDFVLREELFEKALAQDSETDYYLIYGLRLSQYFVVELAKRTDKAITLFPNTGAISKCDHVEMSAPLLAMGRKEVYPCLDMEDLYKAIDVIRTKKMLASLKVLFPLQIGTHSPGGQSFFLSLEDISDRFGLQFVNPNAFDVFKTIDSLSDEERAAARKVAETLVSEAKGVHLPAENTVKDAEFYVAVKKMMENRECNAFTIPCFEICATMELQRRGLTFCLTHSLLTDEGVPSACAGDVCSIVTKCILMSIAGKAPYMGNTMVMDRKANQLRLLHDVPCRKMKGYDQPDLPVELVSFTMDNWGTTLRYDFTKDIGETVTLINISPDMKKMMIVKGEINGCDDYLTPECKLAVRFKVEDAEKFIKGQKYVGHHFSLVYGDYTDSLEALAEAYGMDILKA